MLSTIKVNSKPLSIISKLYVWSILLESFLYFVLAHPSTFGVGVSVARILQIVVILYLVLKINNKNFLKVHKSTIVNIQHIEKFFRGKAGYLLMSDGSSVNVSVRKKEELLNLLKGNV